MFFWRRKTDVTLDKVRAAAREALRARFEDEIEGWMHEPEPDPSRLAARLVAVLDDIAR